jgi:hypothetical protein
VDSFLNIFDLAENVGVSNLEISTLKKAKRRILAEIELDDNQVEIKGKIFTKSDCLNLFDEIDKDNEILRFHHTIYFNYKLNDFLYGVSTKIPTKAFVNPLGGTDTKFINFVSPYFAKQFRDIYKKAFEQGNLEVIKYIPPISDKFLEDIYLPVQKILEDLKNEATLSNVKNRFSENDIEKINALPNYFSKSRNDIAMSIRSLSVDAWNKNEDLGLAFQILNIAEKFVVSQQTKLKLEEDRKGLEDLKEKKKEANLCQLCKSREIEKDTIVEVPIYKIISKDFLGTQYQTANAKLPACSTCYEEANSNSANETKFLIKMIITLAVIILGQGLPLIIVVWIALNKQGRKSIKNFFTTKLKDFNTYPYSSHPIVKLLEKDNWEIGREPTR